MVYLLRRGLIKVIESAKNGEIKKYAPAFTGLGAFRGGAEEGVWCGCWVKYEICYHESSLI